MLLIIGVRRLSPYEIFIRVGYMEPTHRTTNQPITYYKESSRYVYMCSILKRTRANWHKLLY